MRDSSRTFALAAAAIAVIVAGCAVEYIPNTTIEDTEANREIVEFCERYRHAVEDMNVGLLLSMASPRYFDNSGTSTGDDDFDRAGLEEVLDDRFRDVDSVRYEIRYRDIYEQDGLVHVDYTYTMSFQYTVDGETKWSNKTADNRLELQPVEDGFLIVAGM